MTDGPSSPFSSRIRGRRCRFFRRLLLAARNNVLPQKWHTTLSPRSRTAKKIEGRMTDAIVTEIALARATPIPTERSGWSRMNRTRLCACGKLCRRGREMGAVTGARMLLGDETENAGSASRATHAELIFQQTERILPRLLPETRRAKISLFLFFPCH